MEHTTLEELQAQFKLIQQEEVSHHLSERNCVELIMRLISLNMISVIFTLSGREYLTPKHLENEIQDEILQHRGRVNMVELQPLLNVDLTHIEKKIEELIKKDKQLQLIDGEIITSYYLDGIAEEINETLEEVGELQIGDLAKRFGLTSEFIQQVVEKRLGKIIFGKLENGTLYTNTFVERHCAKIRGIFTALTRPTPISVLVMQHQLQERLFYSILEDLISRSQLNGTIQGRAERAIFVPAVFSHGRQLWIQSFYSQNGYIDYQTLERLQFSKPRVYLESNFANGLALNSCFVSPSILKQVDAVCYETISSGTWIDITPFVPSSLDQVDILLLLEHCPSISQGKAKKGVIIADHYLASNDFLDRCLKLYDQAVKDKVQKGLLPTESPAKQEAYQDNAAKRSTAKKREKSKKGRAETTTKGKIKEDTFERETLADFQKWFEDAPEEFLESLISHLSNSLAHIKDEASRAVFVDNPETRQKNDTFQEESNTLYSNIQLFQKALEFIPEEQVLLEKHLLKTLCNELVNRILSNQAMHHCITITEIQTPVHQSEILNQLPSQFGVPLAKLIKTLSGKSVKDFIVQLEAVADMCQLRFKTLDKKSERQLVFTHRQLLMDQLAKETNPATCFHLVVVLLFAKQFSSIVHAPGRAISSILAKLKSSLALETYSQLTEFQNLVIQFLTNNTPQVESLLTEMLPQLKELVLGKEETNKREEKNTGQ